MNLAGWSRVLGKLEREYDADEDTLAERIGKARDYVDSNTHRADLVADLPTSAPPGYLMVKAGDPNLYVGAGLANPLRKIPTQAV
jgi:hypothetical protein